MLRELCNELCTIKVLKTCINVGKSDGRVLR